jgi:deazaflavin-dependent oxidoreductase (nitroreductase family)
MTGWNDRIVAEFRENEGRVGGPFEGSNLLLLATTGAKTGATRVSPMMYFAEPEGFFVVASKGGAPEHPGWFHNLLANPDVHVERATGTGIEKFNATAVPVTGEQRDALFARFVKQAPGFGSYQSRTDRVIPIVKITPKETA